MPRSSAATSGVPEVVLLDAAVHLERADGRDDHRGLGIEAAEPALDVEELLGAEIGAEPGLGEHDVAERQAELGGHEGVAAVGDVAEGPAVHQRRPALEGLHQVRQDRVLEQQRHRAGGLEVARGDRLLVAGEPDDDPAQPRLEIRRDRVGEAEDRHDLAAGHDDEPLLPDRAAVDAAEADDDRAQGPVVHVDGARPGDAAGIEAERVALMEVIVEHRGEQIVRRGDRVEIAGEVQVDLVHRDHLRVAAAGRAALDAEHRPERRLPDAEHHLLAQPAERLAQTDGDRATSPRRPASG